jgi:hypothetical protein
MRWLMLILSSLGPGYAAFAGTDTLDTPKVLWTINPVSLIDVFGPPSLRVGREWLVSTDLSLATEVSGYYDPLRDRKRPQEHFQGVGARFSTIFWLPRSVLHGNRSISLDLGFKYTAGTAVDSVKLSGIAPYRLGYGIERRVVSVRVCMVHLKHWTHRLWTEFYYGVGVRYKSATSSGITQEELGARDHSSGPDNDNYIVPAMHGVGQFIQPDLVIGVRIGLAPRART